MIDMLGEGFHRIEASHVAREKAQGVTSSNIANADTPNYRVDNRSFEDFLAEKQRHKGAGNPVTTHAGHIKDSNSGRLSSSSVFDYTPARRMDGNTVDVQKEMARMSENQLMHELSMRLAKGRISGLLNAIKEGNR